MICCFSSGIVNGSVQTIYTYYEGTCIKNCPFTELRDQICTKLILQQNFQQQVSEVLYFLPRMEAWLQPLSCSTVSLGLNALTRNRLVLFSGKHRFKQGYKLSQKRFLKIHFQILPRQLVQNSHHVIQQGLKDVGIILLQVYIYQYQYINQFIFLTACINSDSNTAHRKEDKQSLQIGNLQHTS